MAADMLVAYYSKGCQSHLSIFIDKMQEAVIRDLKAEYGDCFVADQYGLAGDLKQIHAVPGKVLSTS